MATLPRPESDDIQSWGFRLVDDLENELEKINQAANTGDESTGFSVSNETDTKLSLIHI